MDLWIKYLIQVKAISTCETKESGHYICYKFVDGSLLCFDDAFVNRVDMMEQYKINLIVYRRYDIDPYPWTIDLGFITHVEQLHYSLRCTRNSCGYNLRDEVRDDQNKQKTDDQMDMTETQNLKSPDALSTSEDPLDMSVCNKVSVQTHDDPCAEENIDPNVNEEVTETSVEQGISADVNPKNTDSHESMDVDNCEVQQTEISIMSTGDTHSNNVENIDKDAVHMSVDNNQPTITDLPPSPNQDGTDSNQQVNEGNDTLSLVTDKATENDGDVQSNELPNIEAPHRQDGEMTNVSEEHIELSEFEETVDYGEDSSDDSSSGSSPHDSEQTKPPIVVKPKADWSLGPPLITRSQSSNKNPS